DVHLGLEAKDGAVCVDHGGRVAIETSRLPLENRSDDHDGQLARQALHRCRRRAGNGFGEIEPVELLRLAEVLRVKKLLQADDLRAATGGFTDLLFGPREVVPGIPSRVVLDQTDRE